MSSGRWRKHTQAGVMTSVLMSSRSSAGATSAIFRSSSPASWRRMTARSLVRKSTRFFGSRRTTRVPFARVWTRAPMLLGLRVLQQERDALPAADARRGDAVALGAPAHLQHEREDQARAGRAQRVPERDRATV